MLWSLIVVNYRIWNYKKSSLYILAIWFKTAELHEINLKESTVNDTGTLIKNTCIEKVFNRVIGLFFSKLNLCAWFFVLFSVEGFQVSPSLAHHEGFAEHHYEHSWSFRKSNCHPCNYHLHLRSDRTPVV